MAQEEIIAKWDHCPWCKDKRRLGEVIIKSVAGKGFIKHDLDWYPTNNTITPPMDQFNPPLIGSSYPTATIYGDICLGCGRSYIVKIVKTQIKIMGIQNIPPGGAIHGG